MENYIPTASEWVPSMFETILIPTDGSEPAERAAGKGVELAAQHGATVHALYAVEPIPLGGLSSGPEPASAGHGKVIDEQKREAQRALDAVSEMCTDSDVEVVTTIEYGKPHDEILEYADSEGMDAIVMGTHGRSGVERVVIGSVAEKVVRRSGIPVMTVRMEK